MPIITTLRGAAGLVALSAAVLLGASAAKAAASFEGKRIQVIVPFSEGGGTDTYSRFLQQYMQKHLPGQPKVLVLNKPGAGGIVGTNYFQQRAKRDGTWVMALSTSTLFNYILGDPRVKFDVKEFIPIILSPRSSMVYVHKDLGLQNIKTLKGRMEKLRATPAENIAVGGKTPTSAALQYRIGFSLLGVEVKSVWGMKGNGPIALAFERGEFQLSSDNSLSFLNNRRKLVEDGIAVPLFTLGVVDGDGNPKRDPVYPDTPNWFEAYEAIHGKKPSGPLFDAWRSLMLMQVEMSKSWNLPAGTPKDVVAAWRSAIQEMLKDPDFIKRQNQIFGPYPQTIGDNAAAIRDAALVLSPDAREEIRKFVKTRYGIALGK
ncbi:MAG: tricarboxylate transporter [Alphaproteobacteria bacterium]|nr:tricarboxylate transporter [Alphaproteobacteria bacterium]